MSRTTSLEVDLHVHSEAASDGHEPVELILEHAAAIDLDAVVVTDHDGIHASLEAAERLRSTGTSAYPAWRCPWHRGTSWRSGSRRCRPSAARWPRPSLPSGTRKTAWAGRRAALKGGSGAKRAVQYGAPFR